MAGVPAPSATEIWDVTEVGTMKRILAGILVGVLALVGCNNDVQKPDSRERATVRTAKGPVEIADVQRDVSRKVLSAHVAGAEVNATLSILPAGDGVVTTGGKAMLVDSSGRLLYSLETTVNANTNDVTYRQETEEDYLEFTVSEQGDRVRESYDADGDRATFEYPLLPYDTQGRIINQVQHGLPTDHLPVDLREYAMQADAFQAYYLPHVDNSLNNNANAELLMELLAAPETPYVLLGDQPDPQMNKYIQSFCNAMSACAVLTCRLYPNMGACMACSGGVIACQIFQIISDWLGWGD